MVSVVVEVVHQLIIEMKLVIGVLKEVTGVVSEIIKHNDKLKKKYLKKIFFSYND